MEWHKTITQIAIEASRPPYQITEPMALETGVDYITTVPLAPKPQPNTSRTTTSASSRYGWACNDKVKQQIVLGFLCLSMLIALPDRNVAAQSSEVHRDICVVIGAEGQSEYGEAFRAWAKRWQEAIATPILNNSKPDEATPDESKPEDSRIESAGKASTQFLLIDGTSKVELADANSSDHLSQLLKWIVRETPSTTEPYPQERWLVLIGHGTHDPTQKLGASKFNLQGPDISSDMLVNAINKASESPGYQSVTKWIIVNCSSCSGPFINALSGPNRVIVTATKSGSEQNFARFGDYFSQSLSNSEADLDHDKSISLLEAFLVASKETNTFYTSDGRLPSEQSLLDDNGDKRGTPATFFQGVRPVKAPADNLTLDGLLAKRTVLFALPNATQINKTQQVKIEEIENKIETLREKKRDLSEDDYYEQLEKLFRDIIQVHSSSSVTDS
ncbi:MAG: hypothetical protein NTW52_05370 [Planctomycetota bacterium]|nr:hypothetical protein [Planctomycetota bacterium]